MSKLGKTLSLSQFMVRGQVIKQYRTFLRTAKRLPDKSQSNGTIEMVREEYKHHKSIPVDETDKIKAMYLYGEKMLKQLTQNVDFASHK